jgi:hypothetical protein
MSDKHAIEVRWDFRSNRYIARCKRAPELIAYGLSRISAEIAMEEKLKERDANNVTD